MKKLRSYSSIWKVEQVIHSFGDAKLPIPMTVTQIIWFISMELAVVMLKNVPPLSFTDNPLFLYGCIPAGVTWFMSKKTFALESHLYWKACPAEKAPRKCGHYHSKE